MPNSILRLENVSKVYEGEVPFLALDGISVNIDRGEFVSVIGPSGSGKSTLLHLFGCLDRPTKGEIYIEGKPISKMSDNQIADVRRDTLGFVFQSFNLAPTLNVSGNVELPLMIANVPEKDRKEIVARNLADVGLTDKANNLPSQLSGGQKQRVAIARALANSPKIILADEPTGNLDTKSSHEILGRISQLCRKMRITVILVTHDATLAALADRSLRIIDGKIESDTRKRGKAGTNGGKNLKKGG